MKHLDREAFDRARQFLKTQARPLERTLFEHRFEAAPAQRVIEELAHFQNTDGGFGHALEPDLRTPTSSVLATGIGLRILRETSAPADRPLVRRSVEYLLAAFDDEAKVWRVAPLDTNAHPHAGWWHDEDGSLARTFDDFLVIPRAEIVGLLHTYSALVPSGWLEAVTEHTVVGIETIKPLGSGGGDDLVYALSLAETEALPSRLRERLLARIRTVVPKVVSHDPLEWDTYCVLPLKVAPSPRSAVADLIGDALQDHLDYQIEHQSPEGTWDPVWTWADTYPEAWEQAEREWRGHLTLETLTSLRAFGRIEIQKAASSDVTANGWRSDR
jgi:hypothetical protein